MPDRMMDLDLQMRPLLVQYLKSASLTIASHTERLEKLTADVHLHDDDLNGCAEKMAEVVNAVNELRATRQQLIRLNITVAPWLPAKPPLATSHFA
jgi:hypothetical protein